MYVFQKNIVHNLFLLQEIYINGIYIFVVGKLLRYCNQNNNIFIRFNRHDEYAKQNSKRNALTSRFNHVTQVSELRIDYLLSYQFYLFKSVVS